MIAWRELGWNRDDVVGNKLVLNVLTSMVSENSALHRSCPFDAAIFICKHAILNCYVLGKAHGQMFCYRTTLSGKELNAKTQICYLMLFGGNLSRLITSAKI
jgi:hypothetical protein